MNAKTVARRSTATVTSSRSRVTSSTCDENSTPSIATQSANSRKKPTLNSTVRRPAARPLGTQSPRTSLGSITLNAPRVLSTPPAFGLKDTPKTTRTTIQFDGEGNKENIPPFRLASLSSLSPPRPKRNANSLAMASLKRASTLPSLSTSRLSHVAPYFPRTTTVNHSDTDDDSDAALSRPLSRRVLTSPSRLTRSITAYQKDGKVLLRFGKVTPLALEPGSESDSSFEMGMEDEEDSEKLEAALVGLQKALGKLEVNGGL
ncbi:hypothetical protein CC1G_05274 [Coprinopsis cinerea okayama7|uniref:Uncharacterized protein n=1 Tax=Coprinopsis cinerea (strain Okayama-7 / 130 / ATCC MYA-4618 / FGSC 9003) TaxID=240176 RepID=A8PCG1_COPC7|nr:hypothetical protein CC1G_05274 [Coprinopsis cinerea okayama7\|eukprot:XP_001840388.1 hypothetical protein CC1G_05274 [Coprinopsis cinerea okayama7\